MCVPHKMREFKSGVEQMGKEHFDFIETELGISPDEILDFTDEEMNERIYEPMCDIEIVEIPKDDSEESNRCVIASDIVTILGNSMAEANGWLDEDDFES